VEKEASSHPSIFHNGDDDVLRAKGVGDAVCNFERSLTMQSGTGNMWLAEGPLGRDVIVSMLTKQIHYSFLPLAQPSTRSVPPLPFPKQHIYTLFPHHKLLREGQTPQIICPFFQHFLLLKI